MNLTLKRFTVLGLATLCLSVTSAFAEVDGRDGKKLEGVCRFDGEKTDCHARFTIKLKGHDREDIEMSGRNWNNLEVVCGNDEVYDGDADVDFKRGRLVISADEGSDEFPKLKIDLHDHDDWDSRSDEGRRDDDIKARARLSLDDDTSLNGRCRLEFEHDRNGREP